MSKAPVPRPIESARLDRRDFGAAGTDVTRCVGALEETLSMGTLRVVAAVALGIIATAAWKA
jgi:hypothetical protein